MKKFIKKVITYISVKYISKYIDNNYWKLTDHTKSGKIVTLENTVYFDDILKYLPTLDMELIKKTDFTEYHFVTQIFSRYLYKITDAIIDPKYSWVILDNKHVFKYSWPLLEDPWDNIKVRPSLINFIFKRKPELIEKGILIKFSWTNYYHFFIDTLPQIYLSDLLGIPDDVPLIVPVDYDSKKFVQDYLSKFPLKRKVIVQSKVRYLKVKELFIAKDRLLSDSIKNIINDIGVINNDNLDEKHKTPELIFISRNKKYKRTLQNSEEIELIAKKKGFKIIEPGDYPPEQQQLLFSYAKCIVGIHGAGLTNIIFCKNPDVRILEILPGNGLSPEHYRNISKYLNYRYESIQGNGFDGKAFYLNREIFQDALTNILK